jgi:hypothetical protein
MEIKKTTFHEIQKDIPSEMLCYFKWHISCYKCFLSKSKTNCKICIADHGTSISFQYILIVNVFWEFNVKSVTPKKILSPSYYWHRQCFVILIKPSFFKCYIKGVSKKNGISKFLTFCAIALGNLHSKEYNKYFH